MIKTKYTDLQIKSFFTFVNNDTTISNNKEWFCRFTLIPTGQTYSIIIKETHTVFQQLFLIKDIRINGKSTIKLFSDSQRNELLSLFIPMIKKLSVTQSNSQDHPNDTNTTYSQGDSNMTENKKLQLTVFQHEALQELKKFHSNEEVIRIRKVGFSYRGEKIQDIFTFDELMQALYDSAGYEVIKTKEEKEEYWKEKLNELLAPKFIINIFEVKEEINFMLKDFDINIKID